MLLLYHHDLADLSVQFILYLLVLGAFPLHITQLLVLSEDLLVLPLQVLSYGSLLSLVVLLLLAPRVILLDLLLLLQLLLSLLLLHLVLDLPHELLLAVSDDLRLLFIL